MKEYGVGVIGFGFMGKTHTYAYSTIPFYYNNLPFKTRLLGVCTRREQTAEKARQEYGFQFATTNPDELLNRDDVHIINICTPNASHKELLLKAIKAGKHIYCDKPLVVSSLEAQEILDSLKDAGKSGRMIVNQVVFQNRYLPATLRAKQLIDEGRIGKPLSFRASYLHSGSVDPDKPIGWRFEKSSAGGGVLFDLGSHVLDLIYHLIGKYEAVMAKNQIVYGERPDKSGNRVEMTFEDASFLTVTMKNGAIGTIEASKVATGIDDELRFEIHGDKGALRFNLMEPNWLEFYDNTLPDQPYGGVKGFTKIACVQRFEKPGGEFPPSKVSIGWLRGHVHSLYSFLSCVDRGIQSNPTIADGAYIQYVMEKAYESDRLGKWISLEQ